MMQSIETHTFVERMINEDRHGGDELVMFEDSRGRTIISKMEIVVGEEIDPEMGVEYVYPKSVRLHRPIIAMMGYDSKKSLWVTTQLIPFPFDQEVVEIPVDELRFVYASGPSKDMRDTYIQATTGIQIAQGTPASAGRIMQ